MTKKKARTVTNKAGWYHEIDTPPYWVTPCVPTVIIARKTRFVNCQKGRFSPLKIALFVTSNGKNLPQRAAKQSKINGLVDLCIFSKRKCEKKRKIFFQKGLTNGRGHGIIHRVKKQNVLRSRPATKCAGADIVSERCSVCLCAGEEVSFPHFFVRNLRLEVHIYQR